MKIEIISLIKFHLSVFFLTAIIILSCSDSPRQTIDPKHEIESQKKKPGSSYSDTIVINSPAAVFYTPDSTQLKKIKAITDSVIFEGTMHDCFYQMKNSRKILKQNYAKVEIIEVKNARYLVFNKLDGGKEYLDLNAQNDPCGLFIFDGHKTPRMVDMTNIETALEFYFTK
jgi:hypothetical protein